MIRPRLADPHPDCPCEVDIIRDEDRRPRRLIIPDPSCPIHGSDT